MGSKKIKGESRIGRNIKKDTTRQPKESIMEPSIQERQFKEILNLVVDTCTAKGWEPKVESLDTKNWRYATVTITKWTGSETARGTLDMSVHKGVKISPHQPPFQSYTLNNLMGSIKEELNSISWLKMPNTTASTGSDNAITKLENLLRRFHAVALQLKHRHSARGTLLINDEYDVQDLLHALLKSIFDDVRPEEYSPSYAGGSSRMDFLLKQERIVIEVKMTNNNLKDKQIGEELLIDIQRYQRHPDCGVLFCFVYDPGNYVRNPDGLKADLSRKYDGFEVRVIIAS